MQAVNHLFIGRETRSMNTIAQNLTLPTRGSPNRASHVHDRTIADMASVRPMSAVAIVVTAVSGLTFCAASKPGTASEPAAPIEAAGGRVVTPEQATRTIADRLAELDPTVPSVRYCRPGNRSGQARAIMDDLGFQSVEDVAGGIVGRQQAGRPTVTC